MTTEDRIARLERQVMDLSELVLSLSGRCLALGVAVGNAAHEPGVTGVATPEILDRVFASLLAMPVAPQYLAGFQEAADAIIDARVVATGAAGARPTWSH